MCDEDQHEDPGQRPERDQPAVDCRGEPAFHNGPHDNAPPLTIPSAASRFVNGSRMLRLRVSPRLEVSPPSRDGDVAPENCAHRSCRKSGWMTNSSTSMLKKTTANNTALRAIAPVSERDQAYSTAGPSRITAGDLEERGDCQEADGPVDRAAAAVQRFAGRVDDGEGQSHLGRVDLGIRRVEPEQGTREQHGARRQGGAHGAARRRPREEDHQHAGRRSNEDVPGGQCGIGIVKEGL